MIESLLTFLFWFYLVPVLGLALILRLDKALAKDVWDSRYTALTPFTNLILFTFLLILLAWGFFISIFDLIVGTKP